MSAPPLPLPAGLFPGAPLTALAPGRKVCLDGGHNVDAGLAMLRGAVKLDPVIVDAAESNFKTADDVMRATERAVLACWVMKGSQTLNVDHHLTGFEGTDTTMVIE